MEWRGVNKKTVATTDDEIFSSLTGRIEFSCYGNASIENVKKSTVKTNERTAINRERWN